LGIAVHHYEGCIQKKSQRNGHVAGLIQQEKQEAVQNQLGTRCRTAERSSTDGKNIFSADFRAMVIALL
jgi:hypothetical protein